MGANRSDIEKTELPSRIFPSGGYLLQSKRNLNGLEMPTDERRLGEQVGEPGAGRSCAATWRCGIREVPTEKE